MMVKIIDGIPKKIHQVEVFKFSISDTDDPDLLAADKLSKWEYSESGRWVIQHAIEQPVWHRWFEPAMFNHRYSVQAELYEEDVIYFKLKWS